MTAEDKKPGEWDRPTSPETAAVDTATPLAIDTATPDIAHEETGDWDRHEWSGEGPRDEANPNRWSSNEWAGKEPPITEPDHEDDAGPTGGGHTPGEQHWVPDKE